MNPPAEPKKIHRILLVDDHPVVRDGLAEAIDREPDLKVCGVAETRAEGMQVAERTSPDLAIVDLRLRGSSGLELIKDLHSRCPRLLILVVSMQDEAIYAERALRAGARGYVTKQHATRYILLAIRRVLAGGIYLSEKIATSVIERLVAHPEAPGDGVGDLLTDRELQVLEFTGKGLGTREVAAQLGLDVKTVESYRARIKEKLRLRDASELLQFAIRWNQDRE
jgi:DNA-binding NarL/FixJ family response regulator